MKKALSCPSFSSCFFFLLLPWPLRPSSVRHCVCTSQPSVPTQAVCYPWGWAAYVLTHTHRASPHNTSWQLSRRITMTSQHWETIWTLSTRLNCGGRFSEDGDSWWKRSPTPISAKSLNAAFPKLWLKTNHQRGFLTLSASVSRAESQLITSVIHPAKITWICCDFICSSFLNVQICCSSLSAVIVKWIHFSLGHLGQTKQDIFRHDLRLWEVVMGIFPFLTTSHW